MDGGKQKILKHLWLFFCLTLGVVLSGCESIGYYGQAITGQMRILCDREPIETLLADPLVPENLKVRLRRVLEIRSFAEKELQLPVGNHYRTFVELNRPHVVWNVYAAPEFSLEPKTWCYPIVGCAAYRGYFSEEKALEYAQKLKAEGYDTHVGGVDAYSTLGWFDDPVLSSFVDSSETRLAGLIFHELGHQVVYVPGDSAFNESFATVVEEEGLRRWMDSSSRSGLFENYLREGECEKGVTQLILKYGEELKSLYKQDKDSEEKREEKKRIILRLKEEYEAEWKTKKKCRSYASWFAEPINNAKISAVSVYNDLAPAFRKILEEGGGDLSAFYERCRALAKKSEEERNEELRRVLAPMEE